MYSRIPPRPRQMPRATARTAIAAASTLSLIAFAGCGTSAGGPLGTGGEAEVEIDHATALATARADVKALMQHADLNLQQLDGINIANDLLGRPALVEPVCDEYGWCEEDNADIELKIAKGIDDVIEGLEERVMLEAKLQTGEKTELRYKIDPKTFCGTDAENDCTRVLEDVPVVLRVTSPGPDRVTGHLLVSEHEVEIATLQLSATSAALTISLDLDKAASAACKASPLSCIGNVVKAVAKETFNGGDDLELETKDFGGKIVVTWTSSTTGVDVSVETFGTVRYAYAYKGKAYSGSLGKSKVVATGSSAGKSVAIDAEIGRAELNLPYVDGIAPFLACLQWDEWGDWCEEQATPKGKGSLRAVVDGVALKSTLNRGQKALVVTEIQIGDAKVSHDSVTLAEVSLDTAANAVALTVAMPDRKSMRWSTSSGFAAAGTLALSDLAADVELEGFLRDETLAGEAAAGTQLTFAKEAKVDAGSVKLSSQPVGSGQPRAVSAEAGQCIGPVDGDVDGAGLIGLIQAGTCK